MTLFEVEAARVILDWLEGVAAPSNRAPRGDRELKALIALNLRK